MNEMVRVSELERQHAAHAARREKLWPVKSGFVPRREPKPLPSWKTMEMEFDWHVMAWREILLGRQLAQIAHENAALRASLKHAGIEASASQVTRRFTKDIISDVLNNYPGIRWEDIKCGRRQRHVVIPKHHCIFEVYKQRPDMSLPHIGRLFGVDHTTILFVVKKMLAASGNKEAKAWIDGKRKRARDWHVSKKTNEGK